MLSDVISSSTVSQHAQQELLAKCCLNRCMRKKSNRWSPRKSHFYVYMMYHESGLYYIGKRSSYVPPHRDVYYGSGKLLWKVYNLLGYYKLINKKPPGWEKYIIAVFNNAAEMDAYETEVIRQERPNELCLNCNGSGKLAR
jgi:hypothetical protein